MKLSCKIVEDLLPLYVDHVCSDQTKSAVEEHLQECEECKRLLKSSCEVTVLDIQPEKTTADRAAVRSFKKIRRRWLSSLLLVVFLAPICILGWNQCHGWGIHFTNLHELYIGNAFMDQLQKRHYESAYEYIDIETKKEKWLTEWFDEKTLADMKEDGREKFCESAALLDKAGGITEYHYMGILEAASSYQLIYTAIIDGKEHKVTLNVSDRGVNYFDCDGSFLDDPMAYFGMWSEWLWEEYEGCYFDPETKQYIYDDTESNPYH